MLLSLLAELKHDRVPTRGISPTSNMIYHIHQLLICFSGLQSSLIHLFIWTIISFL